MSKHLKDSIWVYFLNTMMVMACLGAVIFTVLQDGIDQAIVAVVAGLASSVATSLITIMLSSTGAEKEKVDPMIELNKELLRKLGSEENIVIKDGKIEIIKGNSSTTVEEPITKVGL